MTEKGPVRQQEAPELNLLRPVPELRIDYEKELNEQQREAVTSPPGPALVIAGAGSGKTRTLTYRVGFLLEQGIPPDRILLLTFTNKAAREMMGRVASLVGRDVEGIWGGTFHSIGNRVLRLYADLAGFRKDFTILDREDSTDLVKALRDQMATTLPGNFPKADELVEAFSFAVNTRRSLESVLEERYKEGLSFAPPAAMIRRGYEERKQASNALDFDDLLALWLKLMEENELVRETLQRRFQFILVDEYQDTNKLQSDLIDLLATRHKNLTVVGDDAQSIYAWRGAHYDNIFKFAERYPGAKVFKVETNYRSTPNILDVANAAIEANTRQYEKKLTALKEKGAKPILSICYDGAQQASVVAHQIMEHIESGIPPEEIAVLYRSHFHAFELQLELTRRRVPFVITSGIRFFEQAHMKDVAAYLKLAANPMDEISFRRLTLMLQGIGKQAVEKIWMAYSAALRAAGTIPAGLGPEKARLLEKTFKACAEKIPRKAQKEWVQFCETMIQLAEEASRPISELIQLILDAVYEDYLAKNFANASVRKEEVGILSNFAGQFHSLEEFLAQLALLNDIESEGGNRRRDEGSRVRLSTVHQAKGLEFTVVFVIMLCQGLFPSRRSLDLPDAMEEERRLFYVALTRARDFLYLSYPLTYGTPQRGSTRQDPSCFVEEIPNRLIQRVDLLTNW
jgi:DNA helicase-2/ATP-dependent DNA helicase PcrA